jgi:GT2 family glycosyltransferase
VIMMPDEKVTPVSVVVLNCNGKAYLESCLSSILIDDYPNFELIFVDNGSTDGSVKFVEQKFGKDPRLKIIVNKMNLGIAEGHNVGIRHAIGHYIVFVDNDTIVGANWLQELVKILDSDPTIGAAQSKLVLMNNPNYLDCAGGFMDYHGFTCERGHFEKDAGQYDKIDEIFYSKCGAMVVRRDVLDKVGLFDSDYFIHYEETDLCWRIWLLGYRVAFCPFSIVYHALSFTITKLNLNQTYYLTRNCITTLIKNYESRRLVKHFTAFTFIEIPRMFYYMLKKDRKGLTLAKAFLWNLVHLKSTWKKRVKVQYLIRKVPDDAVMTRVMIKPYQFPYRLFYRIVPCNR